MLETKYGLCMAREHSSFNIYSCDTQTVDVNEQMYKQALKHSS